METERMKKDGSFNAKEWEKERQILVERELAYLRRHHRKRQRPLSQKVEEIIPEKVAKTLNEAFGKGFDLVFEKGVGAIEQTFDRQHYATEHKIHTFDQQAKVSETRRKLAADGKVLGRRNVALAGIEGVGLGVLGIGLPDIPLFIAHLLKNVYEYASVYGCSYDDEREQAFICRLIAAALSEGDELITRNRLVGEMIRDFDVATFDLEAAKTDAAAVLAERLLVLKFIQGIPLVGVIGGVADVEVMRDVAAYADIVYAKRHLRSLRIEALKKEGEG